jgi:hypothetical protein
MASLLLQSGDDLLLESGGVMLAEGVASAGGWLLLESGDNLLTEAGDLVLLESGLRGPFRYIVTLTVGA